MITAIEALTELQQGNARFIAGAKDRNLFASISDSDPNVQEPIAIVLGCSDARVPAEIIFDQGIGDLFVIRVAGNVVAPSGIGSVEFAAEQFGTRLVVLLGHSHCGAVQAALSELERTLLHGGQHLGSIVGRITPAIETLFEASNGVTDQLLEQSIRANIRASANHLRHGSPLLEEMIRDAGLLVVGAEYSLETGAVDFFDGIPE
jgi:carbonic anhydrase